nr:hypothetical protein [Nitrospirota bacterium]
MRRRSAGKVSKVRWYHRVAGLAMGLCLLTQAMPASAAPPASYSKEFPITIDASALTPPTWWQVPGKTPMIMTLDPESTEALRTTVPHELKLKPGSYRFGTFTFDFPFVVTLEGVLEFAPSLDQCVSGRGTQVLTITCSRTQPYGGQREY